jgi:hypothetical protein
VVARDELLRLIDLEVLERVDAEVGQHLERIGALEVEIGHVVRLIEQRAGLAPGPLLVAPVREFVAHDRKGVRPDLRIAHHLDRIARRLERFLQRSITHRCWSPADNLTVVHVSVLMPRERVPLVPLSGRLERRNYTCCEIVQEKRGEWMVRSPLQRALASRTQRTRCASCASTATTMK